MAHPLTHFVQELEDKIAGVQIEIDTHEETIETIQGYISSLKTELREYSRQIGGAERKMGI